MRRRFSISPLYVFDSFWQYRGLICQLIRRDIEIRYRGSVMGLLWSMLNPILMLSVYTFAFGYMLKSRWGEGVESQTDFAIILFAGLIVHGWFAECLNRAPGLILGNVNYVKKVIFPLEILPWVAMGSALFHTAVSLTVLIVFFAMVHFYIQWTLIFLPLIFLPLLFLIMGFSWMLAAIGVYLRDVGQSIVIVTVVLMFLGPIFYPLTRLPENYRWLFYLNPLTVIVEQTRAVAIWGDTPGWTQLAIYYGASLGIAWAGLVVFQKLRKGFADVI
ncbi:MAG: ABC transporter permease [Deltaproteobacteria bacterium]|nr:ABC transporter permease [Deltaproteobacteria bacterium]